MKLLKLAREALLDLFLQYLPQIRKQEGFAFIIHPRDTKDVARKYPFLRGMSQGKVEFFLKHFWPVTVSRITGVMSQSTGKEIPGWILSSTFTADMMMKDREGARRNIIRTCMLAERRGAKIIGLGALTASFSNGGKDIIPHLSGSITTGRIFTAKIITDITTDVVEQLNLSKQHMSIYVVGAAGSIGSASAQILSRLGYKNITLLDIERKRQKMDELKTLLEGEGVTTVSVSTDFADLKNADLIITATNHPDALIQNHHLTQRGVIIVDDAQPSDVARDVFARKDVLVFEGGVVHAPGIRPNFNIGLNSANEIYSCLAEVAALAAIDYKGHHSVGEIFKLNAESFNAISKVAQSLGFKRGEFQNEHIVYDESDITRVGTLIAERHAQ